MAEKTIKIGLSLGADICWPICFEEIFSRLDLSVQRGDDLLRFEVERLSIEPFDLQQPCDYDVVVDRLTHWYHTSREWIKKSILMDDLYVFNNPWTIQSMEKHTSYCAMMRLGLPVPDTWMIPPKEYEDLTDLKPTLERYAKLFDLTAIGKKLGYPMFMKPYDGGAWVGVHKIDDAEGLTKAYEASGSRIMHLQKAVLPHDIFIRTLGVGPQVRCMKYDPGAPLHERYQVAFDFLNTEEAELLGDMVLTINSFFGWDFNSCETLRQDGEFYPIDFANACPDSQITSLHYHFPWLVKAKIRWAIYCAATGRKMQRTLDWEPYFEIADTDLPYREKLREYGKIAREKLEYEQFKTFCDEHLADLDRIAWEFFGTDEAKGAFRAKVEALFPAHEHDEFTEHFWGLVQFWRKTEADVHGFTS